MPGAGDSLRGSVRRGTRRASAAAAARYRAAVLERSRWLPAYLMAVDAADLALRATRAARRRHAPIGPWTEPDPAEAAVLRAGLSSSGELSLVLAGPSDWRGSVAGVALVAGEEHVALGGGLCELAAGRVRLCASVPFERLTPGRWRTVLLDRAGAQLPATTVRRRALPTHDGLGTNRLEIEDGRLMLVRGPDTPTRIEHRVITGIARLTVEWTPPAGTPPELLLLDPDARAVHRVAAVAAPGPYALLAVVDAATPGVDTTVTHDLTVAVPGTDGPLPLTREPGAYPLPDAAPGHGAARLDRARVDARYDGANRLCLRVRPAG